MSLELFIQPSGAILVTDQNLEQITHISDNLGRILGLSSTGKETRQFLGQDLSTVLPRPLIHDLCNACSCPTITRQREDLGTRKIAANTLDIRVHCCGDKTIIEFEPQPQQQERPGHLITQLKALFQQEYTRQNLLIEATQALQLTTEFERATAYRFLPDGSAQVVAEAGLPAMNSVPVVQYPATTIPITTRTVLLNSFLRQVGHLHAPLVPILSGDHTETPLDLSLSHLRGYTQPFQEYPQAADTEASLAIAIPIQEQLWGMFVLEHPFPKRLSLDFRDRIELFGQLIALRLQQLLEQEQEKESRPIPSSVPVISSPPASRSNLEVERQEAILVLEDNMMLAIELENSLKQLGFQTIESAPSVSRALRLLERQTFQLGFLDINLKGENSFAIADMLMKLGIPCAFTSGYDSGQNRPQALQSIPLLKKPIELEQLKQTVGELLS